MTAPARLLWALPALAGALLAGTLAWVVGMPGGEQTLGAFATSVAARNAAQVSNAHRAARALDGAVVGPGEEFSFNERVGPWGPERGYRRAPVSYAGDIIWDWGGGVCQTSTTLYNAALLAGMTITERHRHHWPSDYVPPGLDAAVAQYDVDLRFRNPLNRPVTIRSRIEGDRLVCEIVGRGRAPVRYRIQREVERVARPARVIRPSAQLASGRRRVVTRGRPGYRVVVYRVAVRSGHETCRELLHVDTYPPANSLIEIGSRE